jgi:hypothetical protein
VVSELDQIVERAELGLEVMLGIVSYRGGGILEVIAERIFRGATSTKGVIPFLNLKGRQLEGMLRNVIWIPQQSKVISQTLPLM